MKEKIKKYWWIIIVILAIGGIFYWFQWRPSEIRKECAKNLLEVAKGKNLSADDLKLGLDYCLKSHGLSK